MTTIKMRCLRRSTQDIGNGLKQTDLTFVSHASDGTQYNEGVTANATVTYTGKEVERGTDIDDERSFAIDVAPAAEPQKS